MALFALVAPCRCRRGGGRGGGGGYLAVPQHSVFFAPDPQPHGYDHVADFVVLVERSVVRVIFLSVQDLAPQGQNGLKFPVPGLLGTPPCDIWNVGSDAASFPHVVGNCQEKGLKPAHYLPAIVGPRGGKGGLRSYRRLYHHYRHYRLKRCITKESVVGTWGGFLLVGPRGGKEGLRSYRRLYHHYRHHRLSGASRWTLLWVPGEDSCWRGATGEEYQESQRD
jgi:hypothetical protein